MPANPRLPALETRAHLFENFGSQIISLKLILKNQSAPSGSGLNKTQANA
jgi:hypothetical protein